MGVVRREPTASSFGSSARLGRFDERFQVRSHERERGRALFASLGPALDVRSLCDELVMSDEAERWFALVATAARALQGRRDAGPFRG
jgi:hypothetical protein